MDFILKNNKHIFNQERYYSKMFLCISDDFIFVEENDILIIFNDYDNNLWNRLTILISLKTMP